MNYYIGSSSAVINARVTVTVILSLLILLPSLSVCQAMWVDLDVDSDVYRSLYSYDDCILPEQPENGHYKVDDCAEPCSKRPNDLVFEDTILTYTCKDNYILKGNTFLMCLEQKWNTPPSCVKGCPPLRSISVDISCSYEGEIVSCIEDVLPGTKATLACEQSYALPVTHDPVYREITCLNNGSWDNPIFHCVPECGISPQGISYQDDFLSKYVRKETGKALVMPWYVNIYYFKAKKNEYKLQCGGTLISSNLVISAAHCFYDEVFGKFVDASNFAVAAGKYYRDWDTQEDFAQKSSVKTIRAGDRYLGYNGNYASDIALLKLEKPFLLHTLIRPICMDWSNQYEEEQLQVGQIGKIVGWRDAVKSINGDKHLQEIKITYITYDQCLINAPVNFLQFVTVDKFCGGYFNDSSICDRDSGGGIYFERNNVWYLRGVISVRPVIPDTCAYNSYIGITQVSNSREWIRQIYINA